MRDCDEWENSAFVWQCYQCSLALTFFESRKENFRAVNRQWQYGSIQITTR